MLSPIDNLVKTILTLVSLIPGRLKRYAERVTKAVGALGLRKVPGGGYGSRHFFSKIFHFSQASPPAPEGVATGLRVTVQHGQALRNSAIIPISSGTPLRCVQSSAPGRNSFSDSDRSSLPKRTKSPNRCFVLQSFLDAESFLDRMILNFPRTKVTVPTEGIVQ